MLEFCQMGALTCDGQPVDLPLPVIERLLENDVATKHVVVCFSVARDDLEVVAEVFAVAIPLDTPDV